MKQTMGQASDASDKATLPATPIQTTCKPPSIMILEIDGFEGVIAGPVGPTVTTAFIACEMVWIGRNVAGEITEIRWDSDTVVFRPEDFETLRAKSPFQPFTILTRIGGPSAIVRSASELFVGQEAIVVKAMDGLITTIPLRAIKAIEMPPGLEPATKPASPRTDCNADKKEMSS